MRLSKHLNLPSTFHIRHPQSPLPLGPLLIPQRVNPLPTTPWEPRIPTILDVIDSLPACYTSIIRVTTRKSDATTHYLSPRHLSKHLERYCISNSQTYSDYRFLDEDTSQSVVLLSRR